MVATQLAKLYVLDKAAWTQWRSLTLNFRQIRGHSFATVMNSSHFTIHIVRIFIGRGAKAPLGPNEAPPLPVSLDDDEGASRAILEELLISELDRLNNYYQLLLLISTKSSTVYSGLRKIKTKTLCTFRIY